MSLSLKRWALLPLLVLLPLLSLVAGKTWPWQNLVVVLVAALSLVLWGIGEMLSSRSAPEPSHPERTPWSPDAIDISLAIFVILQAGSILPSVYRFASELYTAKVLAYAITFWLLRYGLRDRRWWRTALWCLMSGGLLLAVLGLQEYVRTVRFLNDPNWRVFGPMFNPNIAAGYLLLTVFPAVALLLGSKSRGDAADAPVASPSSSLEGPATSRPAVPRAASSQRGKRPSKTNPAAAAPPVPTPAAPRYAEIAGLFAALLMFFTILLTGSKGALGSLLVATVIFALVAFRGGGKARLLRLGVLACVAATILLAFAMPPLRARLLSAFGSQSQSTVFRAYTWQATLGMIKARPLQGFGGGAYENIQPRYAIAGFTRSAHQSFLQIAAECGIPTLLAGLLWAGFLLRGLYRRVSSAKGTLERLAAAAALAGLVGSALQQMADYAWYVPAVGLSFFALAGLGLSGAEAPPVPAATARSGHRWLALILGLALLLWAGAALTAEVIGLKAQTQISAGDYSSAIATFDRAFRLNPQQAVFPVQIAKLQEAMASRGDREPLQLAIASRQRAISLQPTEPVNYLALSRLYEQGGDRQQALQAVQDAVRWYPTYPRGLAQMGRLQEQLGQHEAALTTFGHLVAVYNSPVGQVAAVDSLIETAYAHAWLALGDDARRQGNETDALAQYRQAAELLVRAVGSERAMSQQTQAAGEGNWGHLEENTELAGKVLVRLQKSPLPVSTKLMVGLQQALGEQEEASRLLRYLRVTGAASPAAALTQAWATLQLAKILPKDREEEAQALAKNGLAQADRALPLETKARADGWAPQDTADLKQLQQWAQTLSR